MWIISMNNLYISCLTSKGSDSIAGNLVMYNKELHWETVLQKVPYVLKCIFFLNFPLGGQFLFSTEL